MLPLPISKPAMEKALEPAVMVNPVAVIYHAMEQM